MAIRSWLVAAFLSLGCQPNTIGAVGPPSADTLPAVDDGAAFAVGFPATPAAGDGTGNAHPSEAATESDVLEPDSAADAGEVASPSDAEGADANDDESAADAQRENACASPLSPGDVLIDELMIESVAGAGDDGEWLEVRSTLDCAVNLIGLHGECARGATLITFDVTGDFWLPPGGTFVVTDSAVPAINHYVPGPLVSWAGHPGDVLRNKGATVSLRMNDILIDTITYPALKLEVGKSWAFPSDCDPSLRDDFSKWQPSVSSWFSLFYGTPNAANVDVQCP